MHIRSIFSSICQVRSMHILNTFFMWSNLIFLQNYKSVSRQKWLGIWIINVFNIFFHNLVFANRENKIIRSIKTPNLFIYYKYYLLENSSCSFGFLSLSLAFTSHIFITDVISVSTALAYWSLTASKNITYYYYSSF